MLTPLDIQKKRFRKEIFGYNQVEVEEFLNDISVEYEKILKDNNRCRACENQDDCQRD